MKKLALFILLGLLTFPLTQCGDTKEDGELSDEELYEFQGFSMKPYDMPVMIMLPDETANIGASTKPEVIHEEDGFQWRLAVGPNFEMVIDDWGADREMVSSKKKELAESKRPLVAKVKVVQITRQKKSNASKFVDNRVLVVHTLHKYPTDEKPTWKIYSSDIRSVNFLPQS